jgi:hypothetical protein
MHTSPAHAHTPPSKYSIARDRPELLHPRPLKDCALFKHERQAKHHDRYSSSEIHTNFEVQKNRGQKEKGRKLYKKLIKKGVVFWRVRTYDEECRNPQIENDRENEQNENQLNSRCETVQNVPVVKHETEERAMTT